jgi:NADPH:quinone reductase-like Zn-dependent oxidoreductase
MSGNTQRQWQQVRRGPPKDALQLVEDTVIPTPQNGEVLVKVAYATTTPASWKMMQVLPSFMRRRAVPELEASGRVVDPNGSEFAKSTEVMGIVDEGDHFKKRRGVLSEYALFKVSQ